MKKIKTVLISGNFNLLHAGHIRLFLFAKKLGSNLIVAVSSDEIAGKNAYLPEKFRLEAIRSLPYINKSFIYSKSINEIIKKYEEEKKAKAPSLQKGGKKHHFKKSKKRKSKSKASRLKLTRKIARK